MNKRQAKRDACWWSAQMVRAARAAGWDVAAALSVEEDGADHNRVEVALDEVIEELERRGWTEERPAEEPPCR